MILSNGASEFSALVLTSTRNASEIPSGLAPQFASDGCLKNPQLENGTPVGKNRNQYMITQPYINFCAYIYTISFLRKCIPILLCYVHD